MGDSTGHPRLARFGDTTLIWKFTKILQTSFQCLSHLNSSCQSIVINYPFKSELVKSQLFNRRSRLRARYGLVFLRPAAGGGAGQRYLQLGTVVQEEPKGQRDRYGLRNWSLHGHQKGDVLEPEQRE